MSNRFEALSDEGKDTDEEIEELYMTEIMRKPGPATGKRCKPKRCVDDPLLEKQVSFIEGRGPRPSYSDVVRTTKPQKAKKESFLNKPIIKCRLNRDQVHTLMDSGATCNLLAIDLFNILREKDGCQLSKTNSRISCANSTNLDCHGIVSLNFSLAGVTSVMNFYVVDGLCNFQAIVGLRSMKKLGIHFDFSKDCVLVNNIVVPFEAKVSPATTIKHEGNEKSLN